MIHGDPLVLLAITDDPEVVEWCVSALAEAGFRDPWRIAKDYGWQVAVR